MIRFIRIEKGKIDDETEYFAWWDTIYDRFMAFDGEQMFESWEDFEKHYLESGCAKSHTCPISRFYALFQEKKTRKEEYPDPYPETSRYKMEAELKKVAYGEEAWRAERDRIDKILHNPEREIKMKSGMALSMEREHEEAQKPMTDEEKSALKRALKYVAEFAEKIGMAHHDDPIRQKAYGNVSTMLSEWSGLPLTSRMATEKLRTTLTLQSLFGDAENQLNDHGSAETRKVLHNLADTAIKEAGGSPRQWSGAFKRVGKRLREWAEMA